MQQEVWYITFMESERMLWNWIATTADLSATSGKCRAFECIRMAAAYWNYASKWLMIFCVFGLQAQCNVRNAVVGSPWCNYNIFYTKIFSCLIHLLHWIVDTCRFIFQFYFCVDFLRKETHPILFELLNLTEILTLLCLLEYLV